ncbi:TPA: YhcH/YjgK/YiaL family protein, partial [Streptococcus pneumoniae]
FLSQMELSEYKVDDDWQQMNGTALFSIKLKKDMLLLLEPNDAHKTAYWLKNHLILRKLFLR